MFLAQGRNDGINRLYVVSDSSVLEYTYSNGEWKDTVIVRYSNLLSYLIACPLRNDDTVRLYAMANYATMVEISYSGNKWAITNEVKKAGDFFTGAGKGRNDDTVRLYTFDREITLVNKEIKIEELPTDIVLWWCIGKGRGDDTIRLYGSEVLIDEGGVLGELTYRNGEWETEIIDREPSFFISPGPIPMQVGIARSDGKERLYFMGYTPEYPHKPGLCEYTFDNGGHWEFVPFPESEGKSWEFTSDVINAVRPLAIGKVGDGDTSRVYCIASAGLVALNMEAVGIEESKPTRNASIVLSLSSNPSFGEVRIYGYIPHSGELKIYNSLGQLVKRFRISKGEYEVV